MKTLLRSSLKSELAPFFTWHLERNDNDDGNGDDHTDKLDSWPLSEFDWNPHENVKTDKANTAAAFESHTWSTSVYSKSSGESITKLQNYALPRQIEM